MPKPDPPLQSAPPLLSLSHATVLRGGRPALKDLSFEIPEGEHTAILGPNGSGKSSLMRLLTRQDYALQLQPEASPVRILGRDRWDLFELRAQLGIVSADLHQAFIDAEAGGLRGGLEVVLSGFFASQGVFSHQQVAPDMRRRAEAALAQVGATHLAAKPFEELSTGEARRVLIARALVREPRALLLDEPTTGLDLVARAHFLKTLETIAQRGKTILLVTHHIEEILPQIQRVILLQEGRVFLDGPKEDVLSSAHLSALYGATVTIQHQGGYYLATGG
ncbi:MAG TPA: ATP-binding cassette domain-containing protein [Geothrix sp.]